MKIAKFHEIGSLDFICYLLTLYSFIRIKIAIRLNLYTQDFFDYSLIIDNQLNR